MVTYPYAYMTYILSPLAGLGGAYRGGRPPTACSMYNWINFWYGYVTIVWYIGHIAVCTHSLLIKIKFHDVNLIFN